MTQTQLNRAVARATGDDRNVINRRGFSLVNTDSPLNEDDLEALIVDWDNIQAEMFAAMLREGYLKVSFKRLPAIRGTKIRSKRLGRLARFRRTIETAH